MFEEVIGVRHRLMLDGDVALGLELVDELLHRQPGDHLVVFAVDDDAARRARREEGEIVHVGRWRYRNEALDLGPPHQQLHADPGTEAKAADPCRLRLGIELLHPVERAGRVAQLAYAVVEDALAAPDTAKIETQRRKAAPHEAVVHGDDDRVVHRALLRVRLEQDGDRRARAAGGLVTAFEPAFGAGENHFGHGGP